ncbi:MAG: hypothetical protein EOP82_32625 [Variovorax sp.]|nr:MAG: hypothetical protein EOP82_32625 [Variovorax sp.]
MSTVQYSVQVRNAMMDAWETTIGPGMRIRLYTLAKPASTVATETGTLLVEWVMPSDAAPNATGGVKTLSGAPIESNAVADGVAGHYSIYDSTGTTRHEQGSVTGEGGGGDSIIDNATFVDGQQVNIQSWSKTAPGA